jgi:hypothetical protein
MSDLLHLIAVMFGIVVDIVIVINEGIRAVA